MGTPKEVNLQEKVNELEAALEAQADLAKAASVKIQELTEENDALKEANESLKNQVEKLLETPDDKEKEDGVGSKFEFEGAKYEILVPKVRIPGMGARTALEILNDSKAQEWLVKKKTGVIRQVK